MILKPRESLFIAQFPLIHVIVHDIDHVIGVYNAEWCKTVTHDSKECHEYIVDDVDEIAFLGPTVNPACQGKYKFQPEVTIETYQSRRAPRQYRRG